MTSARLSIAVVERIGDLILDHLRRLAGIFRVDDDLHVGEIGNRVERHARHRVDAGEHEKDSSQPDQEGVARRPRITAAIIWPAPVV